MWSDVNACNLLMLVLRYCSSVAPCPACVRVGHGHSSKAVKKNVAGLVVPLYGAWPVSSLGANGIDLQCGGVRNSAGVFGWRKPGTGTGTIERDQYCSWCIYKRVERLGIITGSGLPGTGMYV